MTAAADPSARDRGRFGWTPPLERGGEEPERALVAVLSDPDERDAVEVAFVSWEVQLATPDWLALVPSETGLSGPVCLLLDTVTTVAADLLSDVHGRLGEDALALVAAGRAGAAPPERLGAPVITPDIDRRMPVVTAFRELKAALERASDALAGASDGGRVGAGAASVRLPMRSLGWIGAKADAAGTDPPPLWVPDADAERRVALRFRRDDGSLTLTARAAGASAVAAVVELEGIARIYVPLADTRAGREGDARLHDLPEALRRTPELRVAVRWLENAGQLAEADPADLRASVLAARASVRARRQWAAIAAMLPAGPQRAAIEAAGEA